MGKILPIWQSIADFILNDGVLTTYPIRPEIRQGYHYSHFYPALHWRTYLVNKVKRNKRQGIRRKDDMVVYEDRTKESTKKLLE